MARIIYLFFGSLAVLTVISFGYITPINQWANIRGTPGNLVSTPIDRIGRGTSVPVCGTQVVREVTWYALCSGGYVSGDVVVLVTNTPTLTPTRTPTATRTPVVQVPTRIATTPTVDEVVIVTINGVDYFCDLPCSFTLRRP